MVRSKVCGWTGRFHFSFAFLSIAYTRAPTVHPATIYDKVARIFLSSDSVVILRGTGLADLGDMTSSHRYAQDGLQIVFHTRFVVITLNIRLF